MFHIIKLIANVHLKKKKLFQFEGCTKTGGGSDFGPWAIVCQPLNWINVSA